MEQYLLEYCDSGVGEVSRIEMHKTLCRLYALSHAKNHRERKKLYEEIYRDLDFYHLPTGEPDVKVYRDCPQFFVDLMLQKAKDKDICLYTILMLQICTGMRPSEVLNMRTKNSSYGAGYSEEYDDIGAIKSLTIDISKKAILQPLRSDGKKRDSIKKARKVQVFGKHRVKAAWSAIQEYLTYTQGWLREPTEPLFVNKTTKELHQKNAKGSYCIIKVHMARTYRSYANDYKRLILDDVIPALSRGDMEQVGYASVLATHAFGPHMLREYFTCRLYEEGYGWLTIMDARGDKSPQTAIIYLLKGGAVKKISIQNADKIGEAIVEEQGMTRKEYLEKYAAD